MNQHARQRVNGLCPHCGQRMLMRHGVQLPPKLAELFDMIERAGERGVTSAVLQWVFYPHKTSDSANNCVKQAVYRLNSLFESTHIAVRMPGGRGGRYRVVKRIVRAVA